MTLQSTTNVFQTYDGNITTCCANDIQTYQIPFCCPSVEEQIQQLMKDQEEAIAAHKLAWVPMTYGQMTQKQILWIQTRPIGLAWHSEPQN